MGGVTGVGPDGGGTVADGGGTVDGGGVGGVVDGDVLDGGADGQPVDGGAGDVASGSICSISPVLRSVRVCEMRSSIECVCDF